ncbi:MAG: terminase [Planctomycetaceae bacterium]|nr:terminase [Planctomycetaceae bacterium]
MSDSTTPDGLEDRGAALWLELQEEFEFDAHEAELLFETCRTLDTIDALSNAIAQNGVMVTGSQGQTVLNAAIAERRQQQAAYARLVTQLNLVDEFESGVESARTRAAKTAAQAKWRERKSRQKGA